MEKLIDDLKNKIVSVKKECPLRMIIFSLSTTSRDLGTLSSVTSIRNTDESVAINLHVNNLTDAKQVLQYVDGKVDLILVDCEYKKRAVIGLDTLAFSLVKKTSVYVYKPNDFTVDAVTHFISTLSNNVINKHVLIYGCGNIGSKLALTLVEQNALIHIYRRNKNKLNHIANGLNAIKVSYCKGKVLPVQNLSRVLEMVDIVLVTTTNQSFNLEKMMQLNKKCYVIDVGINMITQDAIEYATNNNIRLFYAYALPGYLGFIRTLIRTIKLHEHMGAKKHRTVRLITPPIIGRNGDIIVDTINSPTRILGISDGNGNILPSHIDLKHLIRQK